jgi:hypothetical protein
MNNNSNNHERRQVTVNIGQELDKEKQSLCHPFDVDAPVDVTLGKLSKCLGIKPIDWDKFLPRNN